MKLLFITLILAFSIGIFGQDVKIPVTPPDGVDVENTKPVEFFEPIQKTILCIPIVEKTDTSIILKCEGIRIEIQDENFYGHISYVIIPNTTEVRVKTMFYLPMPPEENYIKK